MPCGPGSRTLLGITINPEPWFPRATATPPAPQSSLAAPAERPMSDAERAHVLLELKNLQVQLDEILQGQNGGSQMQKEVTPAEQAVLDAHAAATITETEKTKRLSELMTKPAGTLTPEEQQFLASEALAALRGL